MAALPHIGVVVNLTDLKKVLHEVDVAASDLRPVFRRRIAPDLSGHMRQQYESRGAHLGTLWPPLSFVTVRLRTRTVGGKNKRRSISRPGRAKGGFARPMWDTGRSRLSLVNLSDPDGIRVYKAQEMVWGSRLAYLGPHHQEGGYQTRIFGKGPLKHVPPRPVVPREWPVPIVTTWSNWMADYLEGD